MAKKPIDWSRFNACVAAARSVGCDEDAARDVALATLEEIAEDEKPRPLSHVRRRARWRGTDALRAKGRSVPESHGYDLDSFVSTEPTPEQQLSAQQAVDAVDTRTVLVLQAKAIGIPDDAIAKNLEISPAAVRQILSRGRRAIKDSFKE